MSIKGIEKKLLTQSFDVFFKALSISNYFLSINDKIGDHQSLKKRSKRLRYGKEIYHGRC